MNTSSPIGSTEIRALLRRLLDLHGVRQATIARRIGRSPAWTSSFLAGGERKKFLDYDDLRDVVEAIGIDMPSFWALLYGGLPRVPTLPIWSEIEEMIDSKIDQRLGDDQARVDSQPEELQPLENPDD